MDICARITDIHVTKRICKYIERGFKICDIKHTKTCRRLYQSKTEEERETHDEEYHSLVFAVRFGNQQVVDILLDIINDEQKVEYRDKIMNCLLSNRRIKDINGFIKVFALFTFTEEEETNFLLESVKNNQLEIFKFLLPRREVYLKENRDELLFLSIDYRRRDFFELLLPKKSENILGKEIEDVLIGKLVDRRLCMFMLVMHERGFNFTGHVSDTGERSIDGYLHSCLGEYQGLNICELIVRLLIGKTIPFSVKNYHTCKHTGCALRNR